VGDWEFPLKERKDGELSLTGWPRDATTSKHKVWHLQFKPWARGPPGLASWLADGALDKAKLALHGARHLGRVLWRSNAGQACRVEVWASVTWLMAPSTKLNSPFMETAAYIACCGGQSRAGVS